ncbi:hypothetical protein EJA72_14045 [Pseudomonas sp. PB120]|uniref:hypothetical protein n=1 Tax=Pseudomonas sp. PB120 TaxID=2494700 RepID=UPI0012FDE42D|nr:hypothetical protein [Pseudomonas sp. PB120]MVV49349.1 hypothetical protein [Pseudomonas sp. PB120]
MKITKSSFAGFSLVAAFALTTQLSMERLLPVADAAPMKFDSDLNALMYTKDAAVLNSVKNELKPKQNAASGLIVADCDLPHDQCT